MRSIFPGVLTPAEAANLAVDVGYLDFADARLRGVLSHISGDFSFEPPSYIRVERRPGGCPWHHDTGTKRHMEWCELSGSLLLTSPSTFTGGGFYFRDAPDSPIFHYLDLVLADNAPENEHRVAPNSGNRVALLFFLGKLE